MSFGEGLGQLVGGVMGADHLEAGVDSVNGTANGFGRTVEPYNSFGQSFLNPATDAIGGVSHAAGTKSYDDFMRDYQTSPGARYQMGQATEAQNNSAAASGKLLSGSNERALSNINQGIASTYANQAYGSYLQGNQQNFGQLETSLGNMFGAIGIGTTATGQEAGVAGSQIGANANLAAAQAKNDQSKGSGLGSMFGGLGSLAAMF